MKVIGLGLKNSNKRGYTNLCYVDDCDFELVSGFRWHLDGGGYVKCKFKKKDIQLHRLILCLTDPKIQIDHIDRNPQNNIRANLRICTAQQNQKNSGPQSNSKSGIKGISWDKGHKSWTTTISHNNKSYKLLTTKDKELAAKTYAFFDKLIGGEFHSNHPYYDPEFYPTKLTPKGRELLGELLKI